MIDDLETLPQLTITKEWSSGATWQLEDAHGDYTYGMGDSPSVTEAKEAAFDLLESLSMEKRMNCRVVSVEEAE